MSYEHAALWGITLVENFLGEVCEIFATSAFKSF